MALLEGKTGLVVGVANERSYAWHIAKALREHGATVAYTHLPGEKNERRTRRAVTAIGDEDPWLKPLDASSDGELDAVFDAYGSSFPRMDFLVHSIAFADRTWLSPGSFTGTPREAYLSAIDVSAYTLAAMANRAKSLLAAPEPGGVGGSVMCMSYYGAEKVVPGYNVMGVAKAALECTA
ncbi:MAG: SDR family oxidoreductase, partial [Planctomycetota bacterium]